MHWKIENLGVHCNILLDDGKNNVDSEAIAVGMPQGLAENLVERHNKALDEAQST